MAYQLHIERDPPISLDEWLKAVREQSSLKQDESAVTSVNPVTGERISIPAKPGDVCVLISGEWVKTFGWHRDHASFKAPPNTSSADLTMATALHLAATLSAVVRGDEGEIYHCAD